MKIFVIIVGLLCLAMFTLAAVLLLARNRKGVDIHMDENTQVKVSKSRRGIRVEFVANDDPNRPSDSELYPVDPDPSDIIEDASSINRNFLHRLASIDKAGYEEKYEIAGLLLAKGIITKEEFWEWVPQDPGDGPSHAEKQKPVEQPEEKQEPVEDPYDYDPNDVVDEDDFGDF
jgi:hypothetical protein